MLVLVIVIVIEGLINDPWLPVALMIKKPQRIRPKISLSGLVTGLDYDYDYEDEHEHDARTAQAT